MPTSWSEKEKAAADGWSSERYVGGIPTEFVIFGGVTIPLDGGEPLQAVSWSERSVSASSYTEKSSSATSWTENT